MRFFQAGSMLALFAFGLVSLGLLRSEGVSLHSVGTGSVQASDPVRYLCVGHRRIDLKSPLSAWSPRSGRDYPESTWPCHLGQLPALEGAQIVVAASTARRSSSAVLARLDGDCELMTERPLGPWEAIEAGSRDEIFSGTYRHGSAWMSVFCWSSGKRHSLALLVLSDPGR